MSFTPPLVFVGAATWDAIALTPRFPEANDRLVADDLVHAGGGPAATAAVAAARLGAPTAFVGTVGEDEQGERILAGLRAEGVDVSATVVSPRHRSGTSVVVVDRAHSTRAICNLPAPAPVLNAAGDLLRAADWVHVDHIGWAAVREHVRRMAGTDRPRLSVDAGNPIADFSPRDVDLFVPTDDALRRVYGERDLDALLTAALTDGADTVVATRGALGSVAATADGHRESVPGHSVDVVSTLGAGDVYHGALLADFSRGAPLSECLCRANTAAALSCRGLDGRSAIPTALDLSAHLATQSA